MPIVVEDWPSLRKPGKYPWAEHADGRIHLWEHGKDYTCSPDTMASMARKWAAENGYRCQYRKVTDTDARGRRAIKGILIQFTRPDGQADPMAEAAGNGVPDTGPTATEAPSYRDPFAA